VQQARKFSAARHAVQINWVLGAIYGVLDMRWSFTFCAIGFVEHLVIGCMHNMEELHFYDAEDAHL
jgi:hypothetical protein